MWVFCLGEVFICYMKIIVNESQVRRIIEQQLADESTGSTQVGHTRVYPITNSFESGKFDLQNTTEIDDAIKSITQEIKGYPQNQTFTVTIESSESKVPNSGVGLERGDLSKRRADAAMKYLQGKLPSNATVKVNDRGSQGPEWDPKKGSRHADYTKFQYVTLELQGTGQNTTTGKTKTYCEEKFEGKGRFGNPATGFISDIQKIDLKDGEGVITLLYNPVDVPDIFVVEYNGKSQSTGLLGTDNEYYRLMIGTILGNYYKEKEKPWWLKNLTYSPIEQSEARKILNQYKEYISPDDLQHVFPGVSVQPNMFRNYSEIVPYILTPKQIKGYGGESYATSTWSSSINKVPEQQFVKVFVVGLIGQTRWHFNFSCGQK